MARTIGFSLSMRGGLTSNMPRKIWPTGTYSTACFLHFYGPWQSRRRDTSPFSPLCRGGSARSSTPLSSTEPNGVKPRAARFPCSVACLTFRRVSVGHVLVSNRVTPQTTAKVGHSVCNEVARWHSAGPISHLVSNLSTQYQYRASYRVGKSIERGRPQ